MNDIIAKISADAKDIKAWRHHFHRYPEISFQEIKTARFLADLLRSWGYDVHEGIGGTGVVASMTHGTGKKSIGLRSETDALPIIEAGEREHKSLIDGQSHACGHDGHMAMLLGAARYLAQTKRFNGTLRLIFQPAEEVLGGVLAMLDDGLMDKFPVDAFFSLHNMPGLTAGKLYFTTGPILTAVDNWEVELEGKGTHGAMPEKGIDPIVAGASLVMALQTIASRNIAAKDAVVISVGTFQAGDVGNIIPQKALLKLTIRTATPANRILVLDRIRELIKAHAIGYNVVPTIREGIPGEVLVNDAELARFAADVAANAIGEEMIDRNGPSFMASDDFAFFLRHRPGFYCFIGSGDRPMVHHPEYDFNDDTLVTGAAYWAALTEAFLR